MCIHIISSHKRVHHLATFSANSFIYSSFLVNNARFTSGHTSCPPAIKVQNNVLKDLLRTQNGKKMHIHWSITYLEWSEYVLKKFWRLFLAISRYSEPIVVASLRLRNVPAGFEDVKNRMAFSFSSNILSLSCCWVEGAWVTNDRTTLKSLRRLFNS